MKNKNFYTNPGFSLLELVIGLLISTILITISFTIYHQITRSTQIIQRITSTDTKIMIFKDRLQQDLLGISFLWFTPQKYETMTKKTKDEKDTEENKSKDNSPTKSNNQERDNDFFYAANNQDGTLDLVSFITTSAMHTYGNNNKMFIRVVYCLKKDQSSEHKFLLLRKEMTAEEFNLEAARSSGTFYEIASQIKKCSIEYGFLNQITSKPKDEKNAQKSDNTAEISWLNAWHSKQEKTDSATHKTLLPKFIKIKIIFAQEKTAQEQEFELLFSIPIDGINLYTSFTQKNYQMEQQNSAPTNASSTPTNHSISSSIGFHPNNS